ncbi:ATP-dependent zinc protease family protein [Marinobacterium arenosum]|uniref:ATP-dependent zinc protease family protein n=1 Tax=Marinobacterium arenosum TaxID=2862496 RepID=UPI001C952260|nr:ATP-dependent zinc protease [Marinobacterium arenosum]MBY4678798.1 ATP-dependent zinc protease [Marinobacterium arenosum]
MSQKPTIPRLASALLLAVSLVLGGCQSLPDTLPPDSAAKPVECPTPEPKTVIRKVTVYTPAKVDNKQIFGAIELSRFPGLQLELPARIDTGARSSSLHATDIVEFERDGAPWVRFNIPLGDDDEDAQTFERPLKRTIKIKRKGTNSQRRPVVELKIQVGSVSQRLEVNLTDRSNFEYPVLIGRDFLHDLVVVDISKRFIADPPAKEAAKPQKTKQGSP